MNKIRDSKNLIVGLDIGTSKIVAIVAEALALRARRRRAVAAVRASRRPA